MTCALFLNAEYFAGGPVQVFADRLVETKTNTAIRLITFLLSCEEGVGGGVVKD